MNVIAMGRVWWHSCAEEWENGHGEEEEKRAQLKVKDIVNTRICEVCMSL